MFHRGLEFVLSNSQKQLAKESKMLKVNALLLMSWLKLHQQEVVSYCFEVQETERLNVISVCIQDRKDHMQLQESAAKAENGNEPEEEDDRRIYFIL